MNTIRLNQLPAINAPLEDGVFIGITTLPDNTHQCVVLLRHVGDNLDWESAKKWAADQGGVLPNRQMAAMLFNNASMANPAWYWTDTEVNKTHAWCFHYKHGSQSDAMKNFECRAVAVRLIPLTCGYSGPFLSKIFNIINRKAKP